MVRGDGPVVDAHVVEPAFDLGAATAHLDAIGAARVDGLATVGLDPAAPGLAATLRPVLERARVAGYPDQVEAPRRRDRWRPVGDRAVVAVMIGRAIARRDRPQLHRVGQRLREVGPAGGVGLRRGRDRERPRDDGERQGMLEAPGNQSVSDH